MEPKMRENEEPESALPHTSMGVSLDPIWTTVI